MDIGTSGRIFDVAIIGGGINGAGIARDAAGRGWSVYLCEKGDLGGATSAASTKLIHGGLRYLEHREFRLVREALLEREVLWGIAPHIIWPLRFVLPYHEGMRPAWLLRLGLFLYDHIGGRKLLPPTRRIRLTGTVLKPQYGFGFEYSDCWVEDSRLVVLTARDAADKGAVIAPRTACVSAVRDGEFWSLTVEQANGGEANGVRSQVRARAVVNAAGPWAGEVLGAVFRHNETSPVRLVKGSHIVVPRLYDHEGCYIFQNADKRVFFAIPYEVDYTLIGTTDEDYTGDPGAVRISAEEIAYLCAGASEYFWRPVKPEMVVWSYSGVRPLYDDGATAAQAATRDYVLTLDAPGREAPLLSVFGGKITTYRRLALSAVEKLAPLLPRVTGKAAGWTGREPLPGGDFRVDGFLNEIALVRMRYPFLTATTARRLVRAYGTKVPLILGDARSMADLGRRPGADLTEAEIRWLVRQEWAMSAEDIVWRRSKLGLRMNAAEIAALEELVQEILAETVPAESPA